MNTRSNAYAINTQNSAYPSFEFPGAICTCGKELSIDYYFLTCKKSFEEFITNIGLEPKIAEEMTEAMGFSKEPEVDLRRITGGKFCCLKTLRLGTLMPISVNKVDMTDRTYPSSLPGPLSTGKVLFWLNPE